MHQLPLGCTGPSHLNKSAPRYVIRMIVTLIFIRYNFMRAANKPTDGGRIYTLSNNRITENLMARGINKVILVGNVGGEPEVRALPNGSAVTNISVATSDSWKDKQTGEKQERTEWHRVVCFNRLGEIVGEYVKKGSKIYIEGSLRTRKWQDPQGQDRYMTEIIASEVQMLDSKSGAYASSPAAQYDQPAKKDTASNPMQNAFDELNDDIPF